jgi:hypothetical protein
MKVFSFLRCGVVIALSLIAGRAGAQVDSSEVRLDFEQICGNCSITVSDPLVGFYNLPAHLCFGLPNSFKIVSDTAVEFKGGAMVGSMITEFSIQFSIDTNHKVFRHLQISEQGFLNSECRICDVGGAGEYLSVQLDSLPYYDSSGIKVSNGVIQGYGFSAGVQCTNGGHYLCAGNCYGNNDTVALPIRMMIIPNSFLSVSEMRSGTPSFVILDQGMGRILCSFNHQMNDKRLGVYDFLGRQVELLFISSGAESVELPTSSFIPGCYFARLGGQLAKFIVPPR